MLFVNNDIEQQQSSDTWRKLNFEKRKREIVEVMPNDPVTAIPMRNRKYGHHHQCRNNYCREVASHPLHRKQFADWFLQEHRQAAP